MTKKKSHGEEVLKGLDELRAGGVAIDETSSDLIPALREHLGKGRETDLAIISLLGRITDPAAADLLASIEREAGAKEIRKEARRALFRLSQKGVRAVDSRSAEEPAQRPVFKLAPEIEGFLSSVDGAGGRLVWLARPQAASGLLVLQGMVNDREGLMRAGGGLFRRRELRKMAKEIKERHGVTMIAIPWEYGDQILYEGFEKARGAGRKEGIEQFSSLRAAFNSTKPRPLPHPVYDRLDLEEARSATWRELSGRLLEESEFRPWVLDEDWIQPHLEQFEEAQQSRIVLNDLQKQERLASIVRDAARSLFSGEVARIFQRRMEDMALYLLETGRELQSKLALALAIQLKEGDLSGLEITFLSGLIQKSAAFYLSQAKEKAKEEPSLIVKP